MRQQGILVEKTVIGYVLAGTNMPVVFGKTKDSCFVMKEANATAIAVDCSLSEAQALSGIAKGKKVEKGVVAAMSGSDSEDLPPPMGDGGADEDEELDDDDDEEGDGKKKDKDEPEEEDEEEEDDEDSLQEALVSDFHSELKNYFRTGRSRGDRGKFAPHSPRLRNFLGLPSAAATPSTPSS